MALITDSHTGSNVARVYKVRAGLLPLRQPVKSQLGRHYQKTKNMRLAEQNVQTLIDRGGSRRPERRTALIAKEVGRHNIDIACLCET